MCPHASSTRSPVRRWVGMERFPAESRRYHLYVSYWCPFSCRVLMTRRLKGLDDHIPITVLHPVHTFTKPGVDEHKGWVFADDSDTFPGATPDPVFGARTIREIYEKWEAPAPFSVPLLVDTKSGEIVNNESGDLVRMLNSEFNDIAERPEVDLYPPHLRQQIDDFIAFANDSIFTGVYKCGATGDPSRRGQPLPSCRNIPLSSSRRIRGRSGLL